MDVEHSSSSLLKLSPEVPIVAVAGMTERADRHKRETGILSAPLAPTREVAST